MSYNAFKDRLEKDKIAKGLFIEMDVLKDDEWQEQARFWFTTKSSLIVFIWESSDISARVS